MHHLIRPNIYKLLDNPADDKKQAEGKAAPSPYDRFEGLRGINPACIFGPYPTGVAGLIDLMMRVFCTPQYDNILIARPCEEAWLRLAKFNDVEYRCTDIAADLTPDAAAIKTTKNNRSKLLLLSHPNSVLGSLVGTERGREIAADFEGLTVVDESLLDFANKPSLLPLLSENRRMVILRSVYRQSTDEQPLGFAIAAPETVQVLQKAGTLLYTYDPDWQAAATRQKAYNDVHTWRCTLIDERRKVAPAIAQLPNCTGVLPGFGDFVVARFKNAESVAQRLGEEGIPFKKITEIEGYGNYLRLPIRLPHQNTELLRVLRTHNLR
ncbi:MAG: hypothetical protein MR881_02180 [Bacteroidales bacterium]|nr:hypothetical protein [Bacteroidales bacterium]